MAESIDPVGLQKKNLNLKVIKSLKSWTKMELKRLYIRFQIGRELKNHIAGNRWMAIEKVVVSVDTAAR